MVRLQLHFVQWQEVQIPQLQQCFLSLMPAMAIQMKRLLAQNLPIQVAYSKLNSFFFGHHVIHLFLQSYNLTL